METNGESQPTETPQAAPATEGISLDQVMQLDPGEYRVTFENRTTWTAELRYVEEPAEDEGDEPYSYPVLHYVDPEKEERNREFPLESTDDEAGVVAANKPNWGLLTKINPKGQRVAASSDDETEEPTEGESDQLEAAADEALAAVAQRDSE